ncbi:MAG: hypothetical protein EBZ77_12190, partial [Chitinophagia bacterium]|nr:hypothetical protein [Chitinophagia bacterium]
TTASGAATYTWSPATDLSATTGATVNANPTVNTIYTVTGTTATGCVGTTTMTVTYNASPSVSVTPHSISRCVGSPGQILSASGLTSYTWAPAAGLSSTAAATVTTTATVSTVYTVTGTTAAGCTATDTVNVSVNPLPYGTPTISAIASPGTSVCTGTSVTFTARYTLGGTAPTFQWLLGGTPISGATDTTYTYTPTNGQVISVRMVSNYDVPCASTYTVTSSGLTMTVPTSSPASNPITGTLTVNQSTAANTYTTTLGNATSGGTWTTSNTFNATVNPTSGVVYGLAPGTDTVFYTVTNACGTVRNSAVVTVGSNECSVYSAPTHSIGPNSETHYNTISATGTNINSSISMTSGSSTTVWINNYSSQGIVANIGSTITINFNAQNRFGSATYLYVDWNNDGNWQNGITNTELMGTATLASSGVTRGSASTSITFTVPQYNRGTSTPITTGQYLHMRMFGIEPGDANFIPPCSSSGSLTGYGQSVEYFIYVRPQTITTTASSLAFGTVSVGSSSAPSTYTLSALGLNPSSGNITVTPPSQYAVSSDNVTYTTSSLSVPYTTSTTGDTVNIPNSTVYVKYQPTTGGTASGVITNTGGGASGNDTVSGNGSTSPYFTLTPTAINFGTVNRYSVPAVRAFDFNGYFLTASGNIVVHSPDPHFQLSTDSLSYSSDSVSFVNTSATQTQRIWVKL